MDHETLLAISNLLQPFREELNAIKKEISLIMNEISVIKSDIAELKADVKDLKKRMGKVETRLADVERHVHAQEVCTENDILPRLRTIEKCYTDTYYRYQDSVEQYEQMKTDIKIIQDVVLEHSVKLQQIPQLA